jgi:hypothetical protein
MTFKPSILPFTVSIRWSFLAAFLMLGMMPGMLSAQRSGSKRTKHYRIHSPWPRIDTLYCLNWISLYADGDHRFLVIQSDTVLQGGYDGAQLLGADALSDKAEGLPYLGSIFFACQTRDLHYDAALTDAIMTVRGLPGLCMTDAPPQIFWKDPFGDQIHRWGVLGMDGLWLIAPQYDAPFHFEKGIAEVIYYGKEREINEWGEFVSSNATSKHSKK